MRCEREARQGAIERALRLLSHSLLKLPKKPFSGLIERAAVMHRHYNASIRNYYS